MIAEGGTGLNHEVTIARSRSLDGPYIPDPANPILTQANTTSYFQTVGHADVFQDQHGLWWGVALATRSGPEYQTYPMGRETVLASVEWSDGGWPVWQNVTGAFRRQPSVGDRGPAPGQGPLISAPDHLDFAPGTALPPQLVHWRLPICQNYVVSPPGHPYTLEITGSRLNLTGLDGNYAGPQGQTFIARRQTDSFFVFSVDVIANLIGEEHEVGVSVLN